MTLFFAYYSGKEQEKSSGRVVVCGSNDNFPECDKAISEKKRDRPLVYCTKLALHDDWADLVMLISMSMEKPHFPQLGIPDSPLNLNFLTSDTDKQLEIQSLIKEKFNINGLDTPDEIYNYNCICKAIERWHSPVFYKPSSSYYMPNNPRINAQSSYFAIFPGKNLGGVRSTEEQVLKAPSLKSNTTSSILVEAQDKVKLLEELDCFFNISLATLFPDDREKTLRTKHCGVF